MCINKLNIHVSEVQFFLEPPLRSKIKPSIDGFFL